MNKHILGLFIIAALLVVICTAKERKEKDDGRKDRHKEREEHKEHEHDEDDKEKDHEDDEDKEHDKDHDEDEEKKHDKDKGDEDKKHDKDKGHADDEDKKHKDKCHEDDEDKKHDKDKDHEDEDRPIRRWKHTFTSKYRRPLDLHIRVPFFTLFLKRDHTGPSKLGLQVFPDHHHHDHTPGSLVDIHHRWWKK